MSEEKEVEKREEKEKPKPKPKRRESESVEEVFARRLAKSSGVSVSEVKEVLKLLSERRREELEQAKAELETIFSALPNLKDADFYAVLALEPLVRSVKSSAAGEGSSAIVGVFRDLAVARELAKALRESESTGASPELIILQKEVADLKKNLDNLVQALTEAKENERIAMLREEVAGIVSSVEKRISGIERELKELVKSGVNVNQTKTLKEQVEEIKSTIGDMKDILKDLGYVIVEPAGTVGVEEEKRKLELERERLELEKKKIESVSQFWREVGTGLKALLSDPDKLIKLINAFRQGAHASTVYVQRQVPSLEEYAGGGGEGGAGEEGAGVAEGQPESAGGESES